MIINKITFTLLSFAPIALLSTDKPAVTLQEIRRDLGVPSRPSAAAAFTEAQSVAPLAANPVPLSIQVPQNTRAISSSPTTQREGNVERKEQEEKAAESKESKKALYTSDEDAKILFELMDQPWSHTPCKEVVQARTLNRFFEAIDDHDIQTISEMIEKDIGLISKVDHRLKYRDRLKTEPAQTLLHFYHEQLLPVAESVPNEIRQKLLLARDVLMEPWYNDKSIDAKSLAYSLTKDWSSKPRELSEIPDEITLEEWHNQHLIALKTLLTMNDALSQAIISGHIEIVDALLNALIRLDNMILVTEQTNFYFNQANAILPYIRALLDVLLDCSAFANSSAKCQKAATVFFKHIGLKNTPQYENYPIIARKLVRSFIHVAQMAEQYWWPQKCKQWELHANGSPCDVNFLYSRNPLTENLDSLLHRAMRYGSPEIFQIIADEMADIKRDPRNGVHQAPADQQQYYQLELWARQSVNGEKLGTLLSIDAHAESAPYMLAMGMLSHVEANPRLLSRLKKYVRKYQKVDALINAQVDKHLLPVLASCVAHYVHHMPVEAQEYILNLRPIIPAAHPADKQGNDNKGILGEHMASIMLRQQNGNNND